jgi:hypothetical protein
VSTVLKLLVSNSKDLNERYFLPFLFASYTRRLISPYMGRKLFIVFSFPFISLKRSLFSLKILLMRNLLSYNSIQDFAHKIFNLTNKNKQQKEDLLYVLCYM